jgi:hypothetical protein
MNEDQRILLSEALISVGTVVALVFAGTCVILLYDALTWQPPHLRTWGWFLGTSFLAFVLLTAGLGVRRGVSRGRGERSG